MLLHSRELCKPVVSLLLATPSISGYWVFSNSDGMKKAGTNTLYKSNITWSDLEYLFACLFNKHLLNFYWCQSVCGDFLVNITFSDHWCLIFELITHCLVYPLKVTSVITWANPEFQKALFLKTLLTFPKDYSSYIQIAVRFSSEYNTKELF